jgi:hypothetical protein
MVVAGAVSGVKRPPTDFELLRAIYERHKGDYEARAAAGGAGRIFVPIDIAAVAKDLGSTRTASSVACITILRRSTARSAT